MQNSVLTQIKVKEEKPISTVEVPTSQTWDMKKPSHQDRNAVTFTHTFESRDQAVAVCRMLSHQTLLLRKQAAEESQSQLPYLADILEDYSRILDSMNTKIQDATNQ
jgi:hypothetical protein